MYFNPSNQVGSGRRFGEENFLVKLRAVRGFILADVVEFPTVSLFKVSTEIVQAWYRGGLLGANAKVSRTVFQTRLLPTLPE